MSSIAVDRPRPVRALTDIRPEQSKLAGRRPSSFPSASSARPRTSTIVVGKSPKAGSPTQSLTKSPTKSKQRQSSPPQYKRVVRVPSRATKRVKAFEVLTIDTAGDPTQPYTQLSRLSRADSVRPPRISPADKTSSLRGFPFSQSQFARLLCSPHRAQILRSHGYLLDKNGKLMVIKKAKNSSPLTSDLAGPVNMTSPSTPPNTIPSSGGDIDISSSAFIPRRAYGDNDSPTDTAAALAAKRRDSACRLKPPMLNKTLPAMPALHVDNSPIRRGILDATDSAAKRLSVTHPPLEPIKVDRPKSAADSIFISPSLRSLHGSGKFQYGVAGTRKTLLVQARTVNIADTKPARQPLSGLPLSAQRASGIHAPSMGHVAAYKGGSPKRTLSKKSSRKFDPRMVYRNNVLTERSKERIDDNKCGFDECEEDKENIEDNGDSSDTLADDFDEVTSPVRSDRGRRFTKLGVGSSIRYANDADIIIMGERDKSAAINKDQGKSRNTLIPTVSGKLDGSPFPRVPRTTSKMLKLPSRKNITPPTSRLARPTAPSAGLLQPKSSAFVEDKQALDAKKVIKGIRGRVSDMLYGRRRSEEPVTGKTTAEKQKGRTSVFSVRKSFSVANMYERGGAADGSFEGVVKEPEQTEQVGAGLSAANTSQRHFAIPARNESLHTAAANTKQLAILITPPATDPTQTTPGDLPVAGSVPFDYAALHTLITQHSLIPSTVTPNLQSATTSLNTIIDINARTSNPAFKNLLRPVISNLGQLVLAGNEASAELVRMQNLTQQLLFATLSLDGLTKEVTKSALVQVEGVMLELEAAARSVGTT